MTILARALSWGEIEIPEPRITVNVAYKQMNSNSHFVMVHDATPIDEGGIRQGAKFCWDDIRYMFDQKVLKSGTQLFDNNRKKHFKVMYPFPTRMQGNNRVVDVDKLIEMFEIGYCNCPKMLL